MEVENSIEFKGYTVLSNLFRKLYKTIGKFAGKFARLSDKLKFQQYKMIFGERDSDIYIATYPKSGTTLLQMILYHLTTDGKMNFKHIYEVSPWIRNASFKGQKPPQLPSPRLIKTHDYYKDIPKGTKGKFIHVYRNGMDVAVSHYHQQKNYNKSDLKFDAFIGRFFKSKAWFNYSKAWLKNRKKLPVLFLRYEDLIKDKRAEIDKIIEFCNLNASEEAIERAIKYSSFEYMKQNEVLFGDQPPERKQIYDQFIRKGKSGEGKEMFSKEQEDTFNKYYHKIVKPIEERTFR